MILTIKNNSKEYNISIEPITQFCGKNIILKKYIIDSLIKHFSNTKYLSYEQQYVDNVYSDGKVMGREYFDVFIVNKREDIIKMVKLSKGSLMSNYIKEKVNEFDYQKEIERLEEILQKIIINMNSELEEMVGGVELRYEVKDFLGYVKDMELYGNNDIHLEEMSDFGLLTIFLNLVKQLQRIQPRKIMIIINNVDHMLNIEEYVDTVGKCEELSKKSDVNVILCTSIESYVVIEEYLATGINVINDDIFILPELNNLVKYFYENYPYNICKQDVYNLLPHIKKCIHNLGDEKYKMDLKAEIISKLINRTLCIDTTPKENINELEYNFLQTKK